MSTACSWRAEVSTLATTRARAAAFALLARSLGPDPSCLYDRDHLAAMRRAVDEAKAAVASAQLARFEAMPLPDLDALRGRWVRWFETGRVAPYEGSNVVSSAGGVTPRLADVSGYYRAFGMRVVADRPDHVVAELEFLAFALAVEADAVERGDHDHVEVIRAAIRSFVRDHAGIWMDAWAARVAAIDDLAAWAPLAAAAASLVRVEASGRNVIPARTAAVLTADAGPADDTSHSLDCDQPAAIR
jgi:nitrate reductase assembly molybdenum cofactor insertion protein NarJ